MAPTRVLTLLAYKRRPKDRRTQVSKGVDFALTGEQKHREIREAFDIDGFGWIDCVTLSRDYLAPRCGELLPACSIGAVADKFDAQPLSRRG